MRHPRCRAARADRSQNLLRQRGPCNLLHPEPARELAERKATAALATGAQFMVTANPGCWMQVAATLARLGKRMPAAHIVQVLNASIQGRPAGRAQHPDGSTR